MEVTMVEGKSLHGITEELYRAIVALVDDRVREIRVLRSDFDRLEAAVLALAEAQRRTEERVNELAEAQRRTEERLERLEAIVQTLAEAQRRTEERVNELAEAQRRTEERVNELAEAQRRTEERLERLEATVQALAEAQRRTEERVNELAEAQRRTEEQVRLLVQEMLITRRRLDRIEDRLAILYGWRVESLYRERAHSYFGALLRRVRVISLTDIEEEIEAHLSEAEVMDLLDLDLLVSGRVRQRPELPEVWLAVEVSAVVDRNDVERAARRAELLRRLGWPVVAAVAGERITAGGERAAKARQVLLVRDGYALYWEQALQAALSAAKTE